MRRLPRACNRNPLSYDRARATVNASTPALPAATIALRLSLVNQPRSSRLRFREFRRDYQLHRLDDQPSGPDKPAEKKTSVKQWLKGHRRDYLRAYMRWLWPHRKP